MWEPQPVPVFPNSPIPPLFRMPPRRPPAPSSAESLVSRIDEAGTVAADTVATGFPSIDRVLGGGIRRRDLIVLAGDTGSGKSALALGIAIRVALAGIPTVFFSGEMNEDRLMERALALEGRATVDELRAGKLKDPTRASVGAAALRLRGLPLVVRDLHGLSFPELVQFLDAIPRRALVVIDPLELMQPQAPAPNSEESLAAAARSLKAVALEKNAAVLAVAQVATNPAHREDPRPTLDDLGGLGAVKQHADVVLGIYREEMYRPGGGMEGATELIVAKNRNGPTGFVDLFFYQKWLRFEDMLDPEK
ncbi:MAG TPA: DnaB-like helicase C-terminal domain-containing protein [Gemmatimonadales bacterium]|nr:DnaB-like helicase C-terminal domain-containing protein [Gemmatimonadales bacterium]